MRDANFQQGADDDQLAAASRLAALVVRYWNDPTLLQVVEQATRVCQNKNSTVGYMKFNALLLSELFNRRDVHTAIRRAEEHLRGWISGRSARKNSLCWSEILLPV